jgi:hypothetical protein
MSASTGVRLGLREHHAAQSGHTRERVDVVAPEVGGVVIDAHPAAAPGGEPVDDVSAGARLELRVDRVFDVEHDLVGA